MSGFTRFVAQMGLLMIVALAVVFVPALASGGNARPPQAPIHVRIMLGHSSHSPDPGAIRHKSRGLPIDGREETNPVQNGR